MGSPFPGKGLDSESLDELKTEIAECMEREVGAAMIYTVADAIQVRNAVTSLDLEEDPGSCASTRSSGRQTQAPSSSYR